MTNLPKLQALGFVQVPNFDASYFDTHINNGFFLLESPVRKQFYAIYTVNAKECVSAIGSILNGRKRNRAWLLQKALAESDMDDWDIYFRPGTHSNNLRSKVTSILKGYSEITQGHERIDPNQIVDLWYVEDKCGYGLYVFGDEMDLERAVMSFVRAWRKRLDTASREGKLSLVDYYKSCTHLAAATNNWVNRKFENFTAHRVDGIAGKTRAEVKAHTLAANRTRTANYKNSLQYAPVQKKRYIDLESTFKA